MIVDHLVKGESVTLERDSISPWSWSSPTRLPHHRKRIGPVARGLGVKLFLHLTLISALNGSRQPITSERCRCPQQSVYEVPFSGVGDTPGKVDRPVESGLVSLPRRREALGES